jgi:hypothetical protein
VVGGTAITVNANDVSHSDTSTLNGAYGGNGISAITVDDLGHVTAISTATYYLASNPNGYTTNTGTVTSVTVSAGTGMSGGGTVTTSGTITLNNTTAIGLGSGISYNTDRTVKVTNGVAVYGAYSGGSGNPTTYDTAAQFIVDGNRGFEIVADWLGTASTPLYVRSLRDCCQNWSSWSSIWTSTTDGAGSGLDADLLDGYNSATAATANTVAVRDSVGDIAVREIALGSALSTSTPTVLVSIFPSSNQLVRTTPAAVAAALSGQTMNINGTSTNITAYTINQSVGTSNNVQFNSLGVNTGASGTAGEIRATNNITAFYSDARLKNFISPIPNAIDKITKLTGYYFIENEVAKSLGYNNSNRQVGVSAQEVQAVLPEVVVPAPISDKYLTVHYEKIIPLLIEAIKELNAKIEKLEGKTT